jgi:hypothetical protein
LAEKLKYSFTPARSSWPSAGLGENVFAFARPIQSLTSGRLPEVSICRGVAYWIATLEALFENWSTRLLKNFTSSSSESTRLWEKSISAGVVHPDLWMWIKMSLRALLFPRSAS